MKLPLLTRLRHYDGTYRIVGRGSGQSEWPYYEEGYGRGKDIPPKTARSCNGNGYPEDEYADCSGMNQQAYCDTDWSRNCFYGSPKDCILEECEEILT